MDEEIFPNRPLLTRMFTAFESNSFKRFINNKIPYALMTSSLSTYFTKCPETRLVRMLLSGFTLIVLAIALLHYCAKNRAVLDRWQVIPTIIISIIFLFGLSYSEVLRFFVGELAELIIVFFAGMGIYFCMQAGLYSYIDIRRPRSKFIQSHA